MKKFSIEFFIYVNFKILLDILFTGKTRINYLALVLIKYRITLFNFYDPSSNTYKIFVNNN